MGDKITVKQAAKELGISRMHVGRLIKQGKLEAFRPLPRKTMVSQRSIDALIKANNL